REQIIIMKNYQRSGTKIITTRKVYDIRNEMDEEWTEFEAFMARRELKTITRRLQRGRIQSVKEGNYIGTRPPYGYKIQEDERGRYLVRSEEHTSELQSRENLVCRLLLEKKKILRG